MKKASLLRVDFKRLRADLKKRIGGDDGLTAEHLKLSDIELALEFMFVYGNEAIDPYVIEETEKAA